MRDARRIVLAFAAVVGLGMHSTHAADRPIARPNIVVIVADDLGWRDVGYHGSEIRTPTLNALAAGGVRLEQHYAWPTCSPTRTALLTSRNPSRFGILGPIDGRSRLAVPPETVTMADVLKGRRYETAIAGKWHLGLRPEVGPRQYGFDHSYGFLHGQIDPLTHLYKNGDRTWHRNDAFLDEKGHATDLIADEAVRQIESLRSGPFFLYVAFSVPHVPIVEDEAWVKPYEGRISERSRRLYAASVTHMDSAIGRIVRALDRTGQREKTLILFTSDNGGQKNHLQEADYGGKFGTYPTLGDNTPLRGWKGDLYEGGIRVPAFVNWPGTFTPRVVSTPVSALDWLPTIAALASAPVDASLRWEGADLWPVLTGQGGSPDRTFYWKTPSGSAIREGDWKLIVPRRDPEKPQLFNLTDDPNETSDRAATEPERLKQLRERLGREQQDDP
jgi:arylsulfatase A-like enzyme